MLPLSVNESHLGPFVAKIQSVLDQTGKTATTDVKPSTSKMCEVEPKVSCDRDQKSSQCASTLPQIQPKIKINHQVT